MDYFRLPEASAERIAQLHREADVHRLVVAARRQRREARRLARHAER